MRIGILPLGRRTFDVPFAEEKVAQMIKRLDRTGHEILGPRSLLFDESTTRDAITTLVDSAVDRVMLLQVTFTDASMAVAAAQNFEQPMSIWAVPEPRLGGRLRLNALCGLNLASHALGLIEQQFSWLYADPTSNIDNDLDGVLGGDHVAKRLDAQVVDGLPSEEGQRVADALRGRRVARIGSHPHGFSTCAYSADQIEQVFDISVDELELDELFVAARAATSSEAQHVRELADASLDGLEKVDQVELDGSLRLKVGLDRIRASSGYDAFAIRCWPETFTDYGGAVCGPVSMMSQSKVPCACEADVYGAITQLVLQEASRAPVFLTDLVDIDVSDNTGVVWHCGQAPLAMRDPDIRATATIHMNHEMPLLYQFPLRPGPVTFLRMSQSFGRPKMVFGFGEMLKRPMAFTGTSGVVRFERDASDVLHDIIASGLEHHMALAYGDHREVLRSVAVALHLPLLEI